MMEAVLSNSSKVMIDVKKGNPLLFLPLEKMLANGTRLPAISTDASTMDIEMNKPRAETSQVQNTRQNSRSRSNR